MTVLDLYAWLAGHSLTVLALAGLVPVLVGSSSAALRALGAGGPSQQVANLGIAIGLAALLVEVVGLGYGIRTVGLEALVTAPVVLLLAPPWLAATGFGVEHLVHPGPQEALRRPIRRALQVVGVILAVGLVFSVLRIHMVVFTGLLGFLLFCAALVGVLWWVVGRAV